MMEDVIGLIVERLESGGTVTFTPRGNSMLPMLRNGKDIVVLKKPEGRLHLFDVPLYKRENGQYVLHRVIGFDKDGGYVLCGDNQFTKEYGIYDKDIIGVVSSFYRKGKPYTVNSIWYRAYINYLYYTWYIRKGFRAIKSRTKNTLGKVKND